MILVWLSLILFLPGVSAQQISSGRRCIEPGKGQFLILVGSSGLFSMFGHDHTIEAKEIAGCAEVEGGDLTRSSVELTFPANKITVLDPKDSASDRAKVQEQMDTDVLRIQEFPSIRFRSTGVRRTQGRENAIMVDGQLTIRDRTQTVAIPVEIGSAGDGSTRVRGEYSLRQTAFGITPVRVAGGAVRVKDEVKVRFELYLR